MQSNAEKSFTLGYHEVARGNIRRELTAREVTEFYPHADPDAFAQGMLDALAGDHFRLRRLRWTSLGGKGDENLR